MAQFNVLVKIHPKIYSSHNVWDSSFNTNSEETADEVQMSKTLI